MSLPEPELGLVIRYAYLWARERDAGAEEGRKDRPCAIIIARQIVDDEHVVTVLPITHQAPEDHGDGVEIPPGLKAYLGLDTERSWIVVTETNTFVWPGTDLRAVPGSIPPAFEYGVLPKRFYDLIIRTFRAALERRRVTVVKRSEYSFERVSL